MSGRQRRGRPHDRARTGAPIVFVERDPMLVGLCRLNIARNGLEGRARAVEADILAGAGERGRGGLLAETADVVATNPPFLEAGRSRASPDAGRALAHHLPDGGLQRWIKSCADILKPKGRLAFIHRADRLPIACLPRTAVRRHDRQAIHPARGNPRPDRHHGREGQPRSAGDATALSFTSRWPLRRGSGGDQSWKRDPRMQTGAPEGAGRTVADVRRSPAAVAYPRGP